MLCHNPTRPLLHFSPGEHAPHRAFVYLTFEGEVSVRYDPSLDADVLSEDLKRDRLLRYEVSPYLTQSQITALVGGDEFTTLVAAIRNGWTIELWNGISRGVLTLSAVDADIQLGILCSRIRGSRGLV
jgi:hypothetical protein